MPIKYFTKKMPKYFGILEKNTSIKQYRAEVKTDMQQHYDST